MAYPERAKVLFNRIADLNLDIVFTIQNAMLAIDMDDELVDAIGRAGLMINDAPNVGGSSGHCWVNKGTTENPSWILKEEASKTFNFSARISVKDVPPKIHINNDMVRPDKPFDVKFDFGTASSKDWIGIYKKDMIPGAEAPLVWMYLNDSANPPNHGLIGGTVTFDISELWAGHYNVYFFAND
mgnify:CR=1 FL=1